MSRCPNQYTVQALDLYYEPIPETKRVLQHYDHIYITQTAHLSQRLSYTFLLTEYSLFARSSGEYCKYSVGQKNGLHAFGYNSAKCEPIWKKFGIL